MLECRKEYWEMQIKKYFIIIFIIMFIDLYSKFLLGRRVVLLEADWF